MAAFNNVTSSQMSTSGQSSIIPTLDSAGASGSSASVAAAASGALNPFPVPDPVPGGSSSSLSTRTIERPREEGASERSQAALFAISRPFHQVVMLHQPSDLIRNLANTPQFDINALDSDGDTALHSALRATEPQRVSHPRIKTADPHIEGNTQIALQLIESGANPNVQNKLGNTPLHLAIRLSLAITNANDRVAERLIAIPTANLNAQNGLGNTPLHEAIKAQNIPIAKRLIEQMKLRGLDINVANDVRNTPLHLAITLGADELVSLLLSAGANPNTQDRYNRTPLYYAAENRQIGEERRTAIVELLLDRGALPNGTENSYPPLFATAGGSNVAIARVLLRTGANSNVQDTAGNTPLHLAIERGSSWPAKVIEFARVLIEGGADLNLRNNRGQTPLELARGHHYPEELIRLLTPSTSAASSSSTSRRPQCPPTSSRPDLRTSFREQIERGAKAMRDNQNVLIAFIMAVLLIGSQYLQRFGQNDSRDL